jgi:hypothetical protein
MGDYHKWLWDALGALEMDFPWEVFRARNGSDVKYHLYHTLLNTRAISRACHPVIWCYHNILRLNRGSLIFAYVQKSKRIGSQSRA